MENNPPVPRTRVLKLERNCCTACVRKVKRAMLKAEGVHSIKINANDGTIEVTSEIEPQVLIEMAAKAGRKAQLLWETEPEPEPEPKPDIPIPSPVATSSINQSQVHVSNFDQTVKIQDLIDQNARLIKHMKITDKRVTKITFHESRDDLPSSGQSRDSLHLVPPPPSDSSGGGGEASGSDNVEAVLTSTTPVGPPSLIPPSPEIREVPGEPPVANVNCGHRGINDSPAEEPLVMANVDCGSGRNYSCRLM